MLPEDDPLNMSIHSRMNVWETKIHQTEAEKEEAARAEQEILGARQQLRHNSGMRGVKGNLSWIMIVNFRSVGNLKRKKKKMRS